MPTLSQVINSIYNGVQLGMGLFGDSGFNDWRRQADYTAQLNYQYALKGAKEMPSAQRQGLESAGYNPMLLTNGVGNGAMSNITGATTQYDANSKINNALRLSELVNNIKAVKSQADLNHKQGLNLEADSYGKAIENYIKPDLLEAQLNATNANTDLTIAKKIGQLIDNDWLPEKNKAMIQNLINTGVGSLLSGQASVTNARTNEQWTPFKIGAGLVGGIASSGLGLLGKGKNVKNITNVTRFIKK